MNPARFLGEQHRRGLIEAGYDADLVLRRERGRMPQGLPAPGGRRNRAR
ncbi:MAG: hypothetical protein AAFN78_05180 [Pseudomonadota bacterium]